MMMKRAALNTPLFEFILVAGLAIFICFYNLGENSLHPVDESIHARVTQEMFHGGSFWWPTAFGKLYSNKPPLKLWLATIPLRIFGESNFGYRVLDAVAGVFTVFLIYAMGFQLYKDRFVAFFAAIVFLGARHIFHVHGFRSATQDSFLILLLVAVMLLAWRTFLGDDSLAKSSTDRWRAAVAVALLISGGVLAKSVSGFIPLAIIASYLALSGQFSSVLRSCWKQIALIIFLPILLLGTYVGSHCMRSKGACTVMVNHEVVRRVTKGYHNKDRPFYYLRYLATGSAGAPLALFGGIAYGFFCVFRRRDKRALFLVTWALLPIVVFSLISSKQRWYIYPSYPALALLAGVMLSTLTQRTLDLLYGKLHSAPVRFLVLMGLCGYMAVSLTRAAAMNISPLFAYEYKSDLDVITAKVLESKRPLAFVLLGNPPLMRNESIYLDRLLTLQRISSLDDLESRVKQNQIDLIIARAKDFDLTRLTKARQLRGYAILPPNGYRAEWLMILSFDQEHLQESLFKRVRFVAPNLEFTGDILWSLFPVEVSLIRKGVSGVVTINGQNYTLSEKPLILSAGTLKKGRNSLQLKTEFQADAELEFRLVTSQSNSSITAPETKRIDPVKE